MGKMKKKGESGAATNYTSRNQALKKLQLSLPDFRRLCILKGIYPREPKNRKKVGKGSTAYKTYYFVKDIAYLHHEPVLRKFREFKIFTRKLKRAIGRQEYSDAERIEENKPKYTLNHIVKERYPTFIDALRDLDDALSMVFLFATLPQTDKITNEVVKKCKRMSIEFQHYIVASNSLRKVFISIKGIYYQAEIQGQSVTWVVPHQFTQQLPEDVDFRIMLTFLEFYNTLVGFVNFQLYHNLNMFYPPKLTIQNSSDVAEYCKEDEVKDETLAALTSSLSKSTTDSVMAEEVEDEFHLDDGSEEAKQQAAQRAERKQNEDFKQMFKECKFFLSREVNRDVMTFLIRSFGGEVSWEKTQGLGATYEATDECITHHVMDRPKVANPILSRHYVQPQWLFDCINAKRLVPVSEYLPGAILPPHLSPFVDDSNPDQYVPPERASMIRQEKELLRTDADKDEDEEETTQVSTGKKRKREEEAVSKNVSNKKEDKMTDEEKKLALMMMPKKKKVLYDKIMYGKKKKAAKVRKLDEKRKVIDQKQQ